MKEAIVFTLLVLWLILVHIFGPRKDKAYYPVFAFCRGISNVICFMVLYFLYECLNILIYDGTILFEYLKTVDQNQDDILNIIHGGIIEYCDFHGYI